MLVNELNEFDPLFQALTGNAPFPWQRALFKEFREKKFRRSCDIPTGLGKTSVIAVWLLALGVQACAGMVAGFPRRLVYVVNRRTVVDQATREVERLREALLTKAELKSIADTLRALSIEPAGTPLAISTLRGQFADNAEWRNDPARPAVIVGTVDMIGSRLLFSGYGCGFKSKPLHAGFLGQDVLLVHDEAHLEPAFQELIGAIRSEQERCGEFRVFRVMELTATSRTAQDGEEPLFTEADRRDNRVIIRFEASKGILFHSVEDEKEMPDKVAELALKHETSGQAILIFLRRLDHVAKVRQKLEKAKQQVQVLTGTLRGLERDKLAKEDRIFARFMPKPMIEPLQGTVYLVCTSAGEVGVDISANHMVCDLTPFDSMAQRLGRVNRFGEGDAQIDIVHLFEEKASAPGLEEPAADQDPVEPETGDVDNTVVENQSKGKDKAESPFEQAQKKTRLLLQKLPVHDGRHDASPAALRSLPDNERQVAFTPTPVILPVSDILFDSWALTSVRDKMPGRPPVADWLHGIAGWQPPETYVAWREEVEVLTGNLRDRYELEDLLEDYPIKPHELLRDQVERIRVEIEKIAERVPGLSAWLIEPDGALRVVSLKQLVEKDRQKKPVIGLADCTIVLPPMAGGLTEQGMLDGGIAFDEADRSRYDVADQWLDQAGTARRCRVWDDDASRDGMRLVRTIDIVPDADEAEKEEEEPPRRYWHWYVRPRSADDDGSRTARVAQELEPHLRSAEHFARTLASKLGLPDPEALAVTHAARWHDLGKNREVWQRSIGNRDFHQKILAKSGPGMRPVEISKYRHEFGSLLDLSNLPEFETLKPQVTDLVQHLIAAHHGRARPHFPAEEAFDPDRPEDAAAEVIREVPCRFARLQRKYGRWGLAYLESLVRAADALASQALGLETEISQ